MQAKQVNGAQIGRMSPDRRPGRGFPTLHWFRSVSDSSSNTGEKLSSGPLILLRSKFEVIILGGPD